MRSERFRRNRDKPVLDQIIHLLACPLCQSQLQNIQESLLCPRCQKAYPVIDGIPIMLVEKAQNWLPKQDKVL